MPTSPLPCPFCGKALIAGYAQDGVKVVYWHHPKDSCPAASVGSLGVLSGAVERWNRRVGPAVRMEVVDDHPVLSLSGAKGRPVSEKMLNDIIAYYRALAERSQVK